MQMVRIAVIGLTLLVAACAQQQTDRVPGTSGGVVAQSGSTEEQGTSAGSQGSSAQAAQAAQVAQAQSDLEVQVGDRVFFDFDSADIRPDQVTVLRRQGAWLGSNPQIRLSIEGHADERGTREYNLALGERRANSVREFLIGLGIASARLRTVSFGKERPVINGSNESAWTQNRRTELKAR